MRRYEKNTPPPNPASQSHSIIDLIDLGEDARASSVTPHPAAPALTAPLPNLPTLQQAWSAVQDVPNPARRVAWCKDVLGEFPSASVPPDVLAPLVPPGSSAPLEPFQYSLQQSSQQPPAPVRPTQADAMSLARSHRIQAGSDCERTVGDAVQGHWAGHLARILGPRGGARRCLTPRT